MRRVQGDGAVLEALCGLPPDAALARLVREAPDAL